MSQMRSVGNHLWRDVATLNWIIIMISFWLRLSSSRSHQNIGQRVVSIWHGRWQYLSRHSNQHPVCPDPLSVCFAMSSLAGLELSRGLGVNSRPPVHVYRTDARFWVKIGFKFKSLCKISNISTADPQFFKVNSNTALWSSDPPSATFWSPYYGQTSWHHQLVTSIPVATNYLSWQWCSVVTSIGCSFHICCCCSPSVYRVLYFSLCVSV